MNYEKLELVGSSELEMLSSIETWGNKLVERLNYDQLNVGQSVVNHLRNNPIIAQSVATEIAVNGSPVYDNFSKYFRTNYLETNNLKALMAEIGLAEITLANIDTANINRAKIWEMFAEVGLIKELVSDEAYFTGTLDAVNIDASKITTGTLLADRLFLRKQREDGEYDYVILAYNDETQTTEFQKVSGEYIEDNTLNATKIVAESITASKLAVQLAIGANGMISFKEGTMNLGNQLVWDGEKLYLNGDLYMYKQNGETQSLEDFMSEPRGALSDWLIKEGDHNYINGAKIYTGSVSANLITAGTMAADRIKGGVLTLGGENNANGKLVLHDSLGYESCILDNNGIEFKKTYRHEFFYPNTDVLSSYYEKIDSVALTTIPDDKADDATGLVFSAKRVNQNGSEQSLNYSYLTAGGLQTSGTLQLKRLNQNAEIRISTAVVSQVLDASGTELSRLRVATNEVGVYSAPFIAHTAASFNGNTTIYNGNPTLRFEQNWPTYGSKGAIMFPYTPIGSGVGINVQTRREFYFVANSEEPTVNDITNLRAKQYLTLSSKHSKRNIKDIEFDEARKLYDMRPVTFNYRNDSEDDIQYGLIAEEVYDLVPDIVNVPYGYDPSVLTDESDITELPALEYSKFVPFLIKVVQELNDRVKSLEGDRSHG